jgi:hypothetical protein
VKLLIWTLLMAKASFALMRVDSCYEYNFSDKESVYEAKQICLNMAMRKAIESNIVFIQSSSLITDYKLREDFISSNTAGFLKNMKVVKEDVIDNRVTTCILAELDTIQIETKIRQTISRRINNASEIKNNGCISVISSFYRDKYLYVTYKVLTQIGSSNWQFNENINKHYRIFWTIFDQNENPISGGNEKLKCFDLYKDEIRQQAILLNNCDGCTFSWNLGSPPNN